MGSVGHSTTLPNPTVKRGQAKTCVTSDVLPSFKMDAFYVVSHNFQNMLRFDLFLDIKRTAIQRSITEYLVPSVCIFF